jgi:hypothetical protein
MGIAAASLFIRTLFAQDGSYVDGVGKIFVAFSDRVQLSWVV